VVRVWRLVGRASADPDCDERQCTECGATTWIHWVAAERFLPPRPLCSVICQTCAERIAAIYPVVRKQVTEDGGVVDME
jgi:hypothetical protein